MVEETSVNLGAVWSVTGFFAEVALGNKRWWKFPRGGIMMITTSARDTPEYFMQSLRSGTSRMGNTELPKKKLVRQGSRVRG